MLDTLKAPAVSENHINKFLGRPSTEWKAEITRGQSANIDVATANNRVQFAELEKLFEEQAPRCDKKIFENMQNISILLEDIPGVLYKNDPFQATIASIVVALNKKFTLLTLPTSCGKTFIIGLIYQYYAQIEKKSVIAVVPNEDLKVQMNN